MPFHDKTPYTDAPRRSNGNESSHGFETCALFFCSIIVLLCRARLQGFSGYQGSSIRKMLSSTENYSATARCLIGSYSSLRRTFTQKRPCIECQGPTLVMMRADAAAMTQADEVLKIEPRSTCCASCAGQVIQATRPASKVLSLVNLPLGRDGGLLEAARFSRTSLFGWIEVASSCAGVCLASSVRALSVLQVTLVLSRHFRPFRV